MQSQLSYFSIVCSGRLPRSHQFTPDTSRLEWNEKMRTASFRSSRPNDVEISLDTPSVLSTSSNSCALAAAAVKVPRRALNYLLNVFFNQSTRVSCGLRQSVTSADCIGSSPGRISSEDQRRPWLCVILHLPLSRVLVLYLISVKAVLRCPFSLLYMIDTLCGTRTLHCWTCPATYRCIFLA